MKKRIVSLLLALVMVLSLVPTTVWAAEDHDGQVRVIVENTTYAKADGAAWDGTLVDKVANVAVHEAGHAVAYGVLFGRSN